MALCIMGVIVTLSTKGTQYNGLNSETQHTGTQYYHTQLVVLSMNYRNAKQRILYHTNECCYAECRYPECQNSDCIFALLSLC